MSNKTRITLDDVYRSLKFHDAEIQKHFNDPTLTDKDYLFYAINNDIVSNALSIVFAIETNNVRSIGVDNSCRTIIEALVVLKMIALGAISDDQARIFRYHYAIVDTENMYKFITVETKQHPDYKIIQCDKQKAIDAILRFHNCTLSQALKDPDFDDSNFYLKKQLGSKLHFLKLLEEYPIFGVNQAKMYDFFSLFIHPRFELDAKINDKIYEIRSEYINVILKYVVDYLVNLKLFVFDKKINTFQEDFYNNPLLQGNVANIRDTEALFNSIKQKICYFKEGYDAFTAFFLDRIKEIIIDMEVSITFGYREHIISLFKSSIEYIAMFSCINEAESLEEFKTLKLAYCYSTRLQINKLLKGMNIPPLFQEETTENLRKLFDDYYKEKYQLTDFNQLLKNMSENSRYFLSKEKNKFNAIVNKFLDDLYPDKNEREFTKLIYRVSKDMNHGGGYAFNSSPGLIDSQCHHVQNTIYRYMQKLLIRHSETLSEHGINVDLSFELRTFQVLSAIEEAEIDKVTKEYLDRANKKA